MPLLLPYLCSSTTQFLTLWVLSNSIAYHRWNAAASTLHVLEYNLQVMGAIREKLAVNDCNIYIVVQAYCYIYVFLAPAFFSPK